MTDRVSWDLEQILHAGFGAEPDIVFAVLQQLDRHRQHSAFRALCGLLYLDPYKAGREELDRLNGFIEDAKAELERWLAQPPDSKFLCGVPCNFVTNAQKRKVRRLVSSFNAEHSFAVVGPYEDDGNAVGLTVGGVYFHVLPDGSAYS